jgi:hypothetical protein
MLIIERLAQRILCKNIFRLILINHIANLTQLS